MKKFIMAVAAVATLALASCGGKQASTAVDEEPTVLTVTEVLTSPDQYLGDTITVEGVCSHLCSHGGRKAFIKGDADNMLLRCEAFPGMEEAFSAETIHRPLQVTGVLIEERIDEDYLQQVEWAENERRLAAEQNGTATADSEAGCETEAAARGQNAADSFEKRMADYRARIAEREANEGKAYLSFYFLQATGYEILPE